MKKTIAKLVLRKEALRVLARSDLVRVAGADAQTCPLETNRISTCPPGAGAAPDVA
jgi:hypothetical protein